MGAVETLVCWENLDIQRITLKNHATGEEKILFLNSEQEKDKTLYTDQETGVEMELEEHMPLLEWLANNYKKFGAGLEIITDRSSVSGAHFRQAMV
jgi:peptide chain release factor subunit 1